MKLMTIDTILLVLSGLGMLAGQAAARHLLSRRHRALRAAGSLLRETGAGAGAVVEVRSGDTVPADARVLKGRATVCDLPFRHPDPHTGAMTRELGSDRSAVSGGARVLDGRLELELVTSSRDSLVARAAETLDAPVPGAGWWWALSWALAAEGAVTALADVLPAEFVAFVQGCGGVTAAAVAVGAALRHSSVFSVLDRRFGPSDLVDRGFLPRTTGVWAALADVDLVLIDKNGTLTQGERRAREFVPGPGVPEADLARAAAWASLGDDTSEGRSSRELAQRRHGAAALAPGDRTTWSPVPFTPQTRMSGVDVAGPDGHTQFRKGAPDVLRAWASSQGLAWSAELDTAIADLEAAGNTVLVVGAATRPGSAESLEVAGAVVFDSPYRRDIAVGIGALRQLRIEVVLLTGDSPAVARAAARAVGADGVIAEADPERKIAEIGARRARGGVVAMIGDGDNDAPALRAADVGIALHGGLAHAKAAADLVDVNSDPGRIAGAVQAARTRKATAVRAIGWSRLALALGAVVAALLLLVRHHVHWPYRSETLLGPTAWVLCVAAAATAVAVAALTCLVVLRARSRPDTTPPGQLSREC